MLLGAIQDGLGLLTWQQDTFAYADSYDDASRRYRGLRGGPRLTGPGPDTPGLLVRPNVAQAQLEAEAPAPPVTRRDQPEPEAREPVSRPAARRPTRFHAAARLDPERVGRDAGRIAQEVIAHLTGLVGADVQVTLEVQAQAPEGFPEDKVRVVSENCRTLRFESHGFEER